MKAPSSFLGSRTATTVLWGLLATGVAIAAGWVFASYGSQAQPRTAILVALGIAGGAAVIVTVRDWRLGVFLFLGWLIFEDLARKYLGNSLAVYFGKDILAAAVYLGFLAAPRRGPPMPRPAFMAPLAVFGGVAAIGALNPSSPSPLYGLLGLKIYVYYVPLFFLGYALLSDDRQLQRFLSFNLVLACVVASLGIVQAIVGLDFLNPATTPEQLQFLRFVRRTPISGLDVPRPNSVFVSDARFAWYMMLTMFLALGAYASSSLRSGRGSRIAAAALVLAAVAILLSGSRGAFLYGIATVVVCLAAFVWGMPAGSWARGSVALTGGRASLAVAFGTLGGALMFPQAFGSRWALYYETIAPWSPRSELFYRVGTYPLGNLTAAFTFPGWPLGYGTGTNSLGGQYLRSVFGVPGTDVIVESGYGSLLLEMGVPGLATWLAWTVLLIAAGWRIVRSLRGSPLFPLGFSLLWFAFLLLFPLTYGGLQPYQNFVFNAYLWLSLGVLYRLPELAGPSTAPSGPGDVGAN